MVFKLVPKFTRGVQGIVLDDDRPETQNCVERNDMLWAIRQHQGDGIALLHAEQSQAFGGAQHLFPQLGVGGGRPEELERNVVAIFAYGCLEEIEQRAGREFDLVRHALGVTGEPRPRCRDRHASTLREQSDTV